MDLDFKGRLIDLCDRITDRFEWNLEKETAEFEEKGSRRITVDENLRETVFKARMEASLNHGLGISTLYDRIEEPSGWRSGWVNYFGYSKISDFTVKEAKEQYALALLVIDIIELYNDWKEHEYKPMISTLSKDGTEFKMPTEVLEAVNKLVLKQRFKVYKYKDTGETINIDDIFHMSTVIGFSSDLTMWFNHIQRQEEFLKEQAPNKIFVTMFGKMDEVHPIYSNWILTLHKGGTIWIVTDQIEFDNPYQKNARLGRRSVWRDQEAHYDECDLPYDLFHEVEKLKSVNSNEVAKTDAYIREPFDFKPVQERWNEVNEQIKTFEKLFTEKLKELGIEYDSMSPELDGEYHSMFPKVIGGHARKAGRTVAYWHPDEIIIYTRPEVFFKSFDELQAGQRAFAILLTKEIIQYAGSENVKPEPILLASEFIENQLLLGAEIDPAKPEHMRYFGKESEEIFRELLDTLEDGEEKTTALAIRTYDVVVKSKHYEASWLTTPEKLQSLSEWTVLDDERAALSDKLNKLKATKDEAWEWLNDVLNDNYAQIAERLMTAKEIYFKTETYEGFSDEPKLNRAGQVFPYNDKSITYRNKGTGIGKREYNAEPCMICVNHSIDPKNSKVVKKVEIRHYKDLMWILGYTDRKQLHKYYRQYRAHNLIPYKGNSILDQTHPFLRVNDPCSRSNDNGITIKFYMCGNCYKKYKQQEYIDIIH